MTHLGESGPQSTIVYTPVDILPGAEADLNALETSDPEALAEVLVFLDEAEKDSNLIEKLTTHGEIEFPSYRVSIRRWEGAIRKGNIFRIRILDTPATSYRVVYGYDWRARRIGLLAVLHKDEFDYESSSKIGKRILDDWKCATGGVDN